MKDLIRNGRWILATAVLSFAVVSGLSSKGIGQAAEIEPKADRILKRMSDYLGSLEQFRVQTENTLEVVLRSGQKIQFVNPANFSIRRPDRLRAERKGDIVNQEFLYDGKSLTLYQRDAKCYATVEAPPSIDETMDFARESLDVYSPGGDLVYGNPYRVLTEDVLSGFHVGMSVVDGVKCHHLAFCGNEVDWQIWIQEGKKPLPRRFIITSKWLTGAPQFSMTMRNWDLSPKLTDESFVFVPPPDARKIDFIRLDRTPQR
jgi:hypothetical protein